MVIEFKGFFHEENILSGGKNITNPEEVRKSSSKVTIATTGTIDEATANMTLKEIINSGKKPKDIIKRLESFCTPKMNAQTSIGHKNISKIKNKGYYKKIFSYLSKEKTQKFTIPSLIKDMGLEDYTKGDAIRESLGSMICMGFVRKERTEYKDKSGNKKAKDFFYWNDIVSPCSEYKEDCCKFNWDFAKKTNFYHQEKSYNLEEEEE